MPERLSPTGLATLYYLHPALAGPPDAWPQHFRRAHALGFEAICLPPLYRHVESDPFLSIDHELAAIGGTVEDAAARIAETCNKAGMRLLVDVALDRIAAAHKQAQDFPDRY